MSIIIGLGITRVRGQISEAIQAQDRQRNYWVQPLWMITLFLQLMLAWWVFYRWKGAPQWNFYLFMWVTIAPTLLYLASGVLCPGELDSPLPKIGANISRPPRSSRTNAITASGQSSFRFT